VQRMLQLPTTRGTIELFAIDVVGCREGGDFSSSLSGPLRTCSFFAHGSRLRTYVLLRLKYYDENCSLLCVRGKVLVRCTILCSAQRNKSKPLEITVTTTLSFDWTTPEIHTFSPRLEAYRYLSSRGCLSLRHPGRSKK
jgi:hypothetical protein